MISNEELSGTGIPYIKTEMTSNALSRNINKSEIFYDMDRKNDENRSDDAKLSGLFKPKIELSGSSYYKPRNDSETFTDHRQTYNIGNGGTFQQTNNDNRSLRRSSRNAGKRVCYEEDISEFEVFEEPTYDVEHLEDRFHQFSRKKLKTEIESIRQACDKIAQQGKVLVNEMKRKWQPDKAMQKNIQLKIPIKANTKVQICELNGMSDLEKNRNQYIWQPNKEIEPHIKLQLAKERYSFKHQIKRVHQNMKISKETHEVNVQIEKELKKVK